MGWSGAHIIAAVITPVRSGEYGPPSLLPPFGDGVGWMDPDGSDAVCHYATVDLRATRKRYIRMARQQSEKVEGQEEEEEEENTYRLRLSGELTERGGRATRTREASCNFYVCFFSRRTSYSLTVLLAHLSVPLTFTRVAISIVGPYKTDYRERERERLCCLC